MRNEIEKALFRLRIEARETRKRTAAYILSISLFITFFFLVPYSYPELEIFFVFGVFGLLIGGAYIISTAIPTLYQPLPIEYYAFKKIVKAIQTLEKSNEPIAYGEVYRYFKDAYETLNEMGFDWRGWYYKTNETLQRFLENLELIVLPAISSCNMKIEHLEEIALSVFDVNPEEIEKVNKMLESEPSYKKYPKQPKIAERFVRIFRESVISKLLYSLALGYGLVLIICLIYVLATQQDFLIFSRENPEIVVLGGLIASGITFWRTKPQPERKSA